MVIVTTVAVLLLGGAGVAYWAGNQPVSLTRSSPFGPPPPLTPVQPGPLAVGPDGSLLISDPGLHAVLRYRNGTFSPLVSGIQDPEGLAVGPDGTVYVADPAGRRVVAVGPDQAT